MQDEEQLKKTNLRNHFLVSMPGLANSDFANSVTYICDHSAEGAMGIVITRTLNITMSDVFEQLGLPSTGSKSSAPVLGGGPVSRQRGFVLHDSQSSWQSTIQVSDEVCLTASRDIIAALAEDRGPNKALFALGYAGWGAGQLENEISNNSWLATPANTSTLFGTDVDQRWNAATNLLGFDPHLIPFNPGHA